MLSLRSLRSRLWQSVETGSVVLGNGIPVAVPDSFVGFQKPSSSVDRFHSLCSLFLPPAAVASLPHVRASPFLGMTWKDGSSVLLFSPPLVSDKFIIPFVLGFLHKNER